MKGKAKEKIKRINAVVLAITMLVSMIFGYKTEFVKAATNTSVEETSGLNTLGFDTSKAQNAIDDTVSKGTLPLGGSTNEDAQVTSMLTVSEAGIASGLYDYKYGKGNRIYDNLEPASEDTTTSGKLDSSATYISESDSVYTVDENQTDGSHFMSCEAFDGDGNGKADQMVQLDLRNKIKNSDNPVYKIQLEYFTYSYSDNHWECKKTISSISTLPFQIRPTQAYGYLSMASGDYDGDGRDEIAVYQPYTDAGKSVIQIYEVNKDGDFVEATSSKTVWWWCSKETASIDSLDKCNSQYKKYIPVVNIEAISQPTDMCDDLAVTATYPVDSKVLNDNSSYDNDKERVLDSYSTVGILVDPMLTSKYAQEFKLKWNWKEDMGFGSTGADSKYELMRFAGASAGNIDEDDATELFVGGYRLADPTGGNYKLDHKNYLYTTLKYDSETKKYTMQNPSWIGVDSQYNNGASSMTEDAIGDDLSNDESFVLSPMAVEAFAERGIGLPESVFVNGYVMGWNLSKDVLSAQTTAGMTYSSDYKGLLGADSSYYSENNSFLLRYAIPVERFGIESGEQRGYMQAVSANFNGNTKGIEELLFTYAKNANVNGGENPGKTEYRYVVGLANNPYGDDEVANTSSKKISNVYYSWMYGNDKSKDSMKFYNHACMPLCVYTCDVDDDSTLVRPQQYSNGKYVKPEARFKDPQILAVLQAQPYFKDLNYDSSGGGTSFTKSKTIGTTKGNSTSFDLSVGVGFEFEVATGITFGFSQMFEYSFGREEEWETENSVSLDTSFGTDGNDSVVLAMTPEIIYYYEAWDINTKSWKPMTIKVPQGSQTMQIPVDRYDEVATASGWSTIRGNILNNEAGDPTSYAKSSTGLTGFVAASNTISNDEFLTTGSGTGQTTSSITVEKSESHTTSYSNSFNSETEATVASVKGSFSIGGGHTESSGTFYTEGSSYEGEVADLPDNNYVFQNYKFNWQFGFWTGELDGCNFPVLGYIVRDVNCQPTKPKELHISDLSEKNATLCWNSDHTVGFFSVDSYIKSADAYVQIATVSAGNMIDGKYEYKVNDLEPDSDYSFRVTYYRLDGIKLRSSIPTPDVNAHTYSIKETAPTFFDQPNDVTVNAGDNAVLTVSVSTASLSKIYYTWQKYTPKGWENISGATSEKLELIAVSAKQNEELYRCRVIQGSNTIYSSAAMLHVTKKSTAISLTSTNTELTATVTSAGKPVTAGANVIFEADNQDTGICQKYVAKVGSNGIAKIEWSPNAAGNYQIHAKLSEDERYETCDDVKELYVKPAKAFLSLEGEDKLSYGDKLTLTPKTYEANSDQGSIVTPKYKVYRMADSGSILVASSEKEYLKTFIGKIPLNVPLMSGNTYEPTVVGSYKIVGTYNNYSATKLFTVDKKDVIVKPDVTTTTPTLNISGAATSVVDTLKDLYEIKADGYDTIPTAAGRYTLYPKVKTGKAVSADYLSKYNIVEESSVLEKTAPTNKVNIQATNHGLVYGTFCLDNTSEEFTVPDNKNVVKGSKVTICAKPEKGYDIAKWIINGTELKANGNYVTKDTYVINTLNADADIKVEFVAQKHKFYYEAKENGSISANYYTPATKITSGQYVSGSQLGEDESLILKAAPLDGYMVERWTIQSGSGSETTIMTPFGATNTEEQYVVNNMKADSTIRVYYVKAPTQGANYIKVYLAINKKPEDLSLYTLDSVNQLNAALVQVVEGKNSTEQSIVDGYATAIEAAIKALKYKDAEYTSVDQAISNVPTDLSIYTTDTVRRVEKAVAAVIRNKAITEQSTVNGYAQRIDDAVQELKLKMADYTAVNEAISKVPTDVSIYTTDTVSRVKKAVAAVISNKQITEQSVVNGYATAIETAIKTLNYKDADYTAVNKAISKVPTNLFIYTTDTVSKVKDALNAVVKMKKIIEQSTVDGYAKAIDNAVQGLKKKNADYTAVNKVLNTFPKKLNIYEIDSVVNLIMAKLSIKYDLTIDYQNMVNSYALQLNQAIANLKKIKVTPTKPQVYTGLTFTSNNLKYIVTKHTKNIHEVEFTGLAKAQKTVKIPNLVTYKNVKFKVTSIKKNALRNNTKVTTVSVGNNVATIGDYAFYKAKNLKKVTIGTGLVSIGSHAFCHIKKGSLITIMSKKLKVVKTAQNHCTDSMVIKVPQSKLKAYMKLFKQTKGATFKKL